MKSILKKAMALMITLTMVFTLAACGNKDKKSDESSNGSKPVEITYATFMVGSHVSAAAEKEVLDEFNKKYEGKIKVKVEELPSDDAYVNKMKALAASGALPDVINGKNGLRELAVKNGQAVDLIPFLEADEEWNKYVGEGAINYSKTDDGKLYSIANQQQLVGYFYNKDMFEKTGITPAKTWDEFMSNNEKLKENGYTPLAMMTGENAWTTNLWLAAIIGTNGEEGNKYMNTNYPESYNNDLVVNALTMVQKCLKDYTTPDAIGAIYANSANNFLQENTAIIANGPWMVPDFTDTSKAKEGLADRVGVSLYPNDGIVTQYEIGYVLCTNDKSKEEQDAALEFLKFKTGKEAQKIFLEKSGALPLTANVELSDEYKKANPLVVDLIDLSTKAKYGFENMDNTAYSSVIEEFSLSYPELVYGGITPEEMATKLTEAADKHKEQ
ncbi:sugar ABC transporter substrate-binding protein [Vallitalea longa]|uniref:Sugar ABC transporter substrate-binding protein n=1 Tax=Vallitalea longa TaxID=2936439 RepID=A0A9W5YF37_9FIRM|nr:ABC transporter substrate-binding protein [Vallitalea longa]GKX30789.1 sugar ABC transporter substrate-binding protein [Vallitalea longa]